eukprot:CAMPEP_0174379748 /NCGR_PEP_ID=MMETSP0811_2-20130205/122911_1 /TAXON_ID=73025 ORGANISM="Eutreptiella gymnastica-like, Strain CCMP1594" /NCGR_SAMPLE_ID=MMETSP0811_2 /ASSEMBLY_ACC=CAM_ASM_000667 /LENGTH=98 /DNA_ID=CAMNT_0015532375 /DNA_START=334 /DNA_END=630 /DNA_ORIENTATION=+
MPAKESKPLGTTNVEFLWGFGEPDAIRANLCEKAEFGRLQAEDAPCLGCEGQPLQLGLVDAQQGPIRIVLLRLTPSLHNHHPSLGSTCWIFDCSLPLS